jgi:hypothetical protein
MRLCIVPGIGRSPSCEDPHRSSPSRETPDAAQGAWHEAPDRLSYLEAGGTLENAEAMAAHESPRKTKHYDRIEEEIMLDEIERMSI